MRSPATEIFPELESGGMVEAGFDSGEDFFGAFFAVGGGGDFFESLLEEGAEPGAAAELVALSVERDGGLENARMVEGPGVEKVQKGEEEFEVFDLGQNPKDRGAISLMCLGIEINAGEDGEDGLEEAVGEVNGLEAVGVKTLAAVDDGLALEEEGDGLEGVSHDFGIGGEEPEFQASDVGGVISIGAAHGGVR